MTRMKRTKCPACSKELVGATWLALEDARADHYAAAHGIARKVRA